MPKILNDPREHMLREVESLLRQGGYTAVTVRSVAAGCGVGVGTVYNYFPSKEAMLAEYLLTDWRVCVAAIEAAAAGAGTAQPVARCVYDQLLRFSGRHGAVFQDESARGTFAGAFSQYHGLLRSQLAAPLARFAVSPFAAEFAAEALLTWTMAGKEFCEIWDMIHPIMKKENTYVQL